MSESVEVVDSLEWQAAASVAAEVSSATQDVLAPVDLDAMMAPITPGTVTTDGAESDFGRAREEEAHLLMCGAHDDKLAHIEEARLEDKYAQTALPDPSPAGLDGAVMDGEEDVIIAPLTASALNRQQGRATGTSALPGKRTAKRPRKDETSQKVEDPAELAFRRSQKKLRQEGASLSLKEILGRSLTMPLDGQHTHHSNSFPSSPPANGTATFSGLGNGSFASPTTPLSSSPSAWSPLMVDDITNRFLANVEQKSKQKVGKVISAVARRAAGPAAAGAPRSQPPLSPGSPVAVLGGASFNPSLTSSLPDILDDELVIGEEDEDALNWMPATPTSEHSGRFARAIHADMDGGGDRTRTLSRGPELADSLTGTQNSLTMSRCFEDGDGLVSLTPAEEARRRRREADQKRTEAESAQALARKHEMWKLKQRHLRAQHLVQDDPRAAQRMAASSSVPPSSATAAAASTSVVTDDSPAKDKPEFFRRVVLSTVTPTASQVVDVDGNTQSQPSLTATATTATTTSIAQSKLSAEDISMIRRRNNYDNTASQSVMVFATASSTANAAAAKK